MSGCFEIITPDLTSYIPVIKHGAIEYNIGCRVCSSTGIKEENGFSFSLTAYNNSVLDCTEKPKHEPSVIITPSESIKSSRKTRRYKRYS